MKLSTSLKEIKMNEQEIKNLSKFKTKIANELIN